MATEPRRAGPDATVLGTPRRRSDDIFERVLDGDLVVYDLTQQRVHILNPTAAFIWYRCDGEHGPGEIAAELADRFPEHKMTIHEDVRPILDAFAEEGLLAA